MVGKGKLMLSNPIISTYLIKITFILIVDFFTSLILGLLSGYVGVFQLLSGQSRDHQLMSSSNVFLFQIMFL